MFEEQNAKFREKIPDAERDKPKTQVITISPENLGLIYLWEQLFRQSII